MRHALLVAVLAVGLCTASGCSGNDNVTQDEASEGWQVASGPLQKGQQRIFEKVESSDPASLFGGEPVTATVGCETRGETRFRLAVGPGPDGVVIDFPATFDDCTATQVIIDGELEIGSPDNFGFSGAPSGGGGGDTGTKDGGGEASSGSRATTITYDGELDFAGDVDGPCEVDLTVETGGGQPSYSGTLCGHDAAETLGFGF